MAVTVLVDDSKTHEKARASREAGNQETSILRLPAEIRNQIYALAIRTHDVVSVLNGDIYKFQPLKRCDSGSDGFRSAVKRTFGKKYPVTVKMNQPPSKISGKSTRLADDHSLHSLGIFEVCKQLRCESMRFYYGFNTFVLPISQRHMPRTRTWLETRPEEFFAVAKEVLFSQEMRRCSSRSAGTKERLLHVNLSTLEIEIVPLKGLHDGCLKRYVEHVSRKESRHEYKKLVNAWPESGVDREQMVMLTEMMQHNAKSRDEIKVEIDGWLELPFAM